VNERSEFYPRLKVDAASRSTVSQAGALLLLETVRATGLHRAPMARSWAGEPGWLPWGQLHDACPTGPDNQTPSRSPGRVRDGAGRAAQGLARVSGLERTPSGWPGTQLAVQAVTAGNDEVNGATGRAHLSQKSAQPILGFGPTCETAGCAALVGERLSVVSHETPPQFSGTETPERCLLLSPFTGHFPRRVVRPTPMRAPLRRQRSRKGFASGNEAGAQ